MIPSPALSRSLRWLAVGLAVALLLALALWPERLRVDSATVERATVRETLEAEGQTRLLERHLITAPVAGQLRRITLAPGDTVAAGQVVATLDASASPALDVRSRAQAQARVAAALAQWNALQAQERASQAEVALARDEAERQRALAAQGMVSAQALQTARTRLTQVELEARAAGFRSTSAAQELAAARALLLSGGPDARGAWALRAPLAGVVLRRHHESAQAVPAGEPLLEIGDLTRLEVAIDVLSRDAVRLRPGMAVELLRWGRPETLAGVVRRVEPGGFTKLSALGVEEQRVWVRVDITSPRAAWLGLGEGYRVNGRFVLQQADDTLRLPLSALVREGDGWSVFRIDGRRARRVTVTVGLLGEGFAAIASGVAAGDRVVVHPPRELADGARVQVLERQTGHR